MALSGEQIERYSRHLILKDVGVKGQKKLLESKVLIIGAGGLGAPAALYLAAAGVGTIGIADADEVDLSNLQRQIIHSTPNIGKSKVQSAKERINELNPDVKVNVYKTFYAPDTANRFDFSQYDYIVDAIDTVTGKLAIIEKAKKANVPVISAMGAGNKVNPAMFEVADIYETSVCPLAKVMRRECRKRGIDSLKVVYSKEEPRRPLEDMSISCRQHCICPPGTVRKCTERRDIPGSTAFVPSVAGLIIAGEIINDLAEIH